MGISHQELKLGIILLRLLLFNKIILKHKSFWAKNLIRAVLLYGIIKLIDPKNRACFLIFTKFNHVSTTSACKRLATPKEQRGFWLFHVLFKLTTSKSEPPFPKTSSLADFETVVVFNLNTWGIKRPLVKSKDKLAKTESICSWTLNKNRRNRIYNDRATWFTHFSLRELSDFLKTLKVERQLVRGATQK